MSIAESNNVKLLREILNAYGCDYREADFSDRDGYADSDAGKDFKINPEYINFSGFRDAIGRDDWGLVLGENVSLPNLGVFGYAVISAPTYLHSLKLLTRFVPLTAWYFTFRIHREGDYYRAVFVPNRELYDLERGLVDLVFSMLTSQFYSLYPLFKERAELFYCGGEPSYIDHLRERFPGKLHFNQNQYSFLVPADLCDAESTFYVEDIWESSLHSCKKRVSIMGYLATDDPVDAVRNSIEKVIAENYKKRPVCLPLPGIDLVASDLELSEAALRQNLRVHRRSFRQIKEDTRREWLQKLLMEPELSIQMIGFILGYQDASNFTRTCVSWFDCTPKQLRKKLMDEAS